MTFIRHLFCDEGGKYQTGDVVSFTGIEVSPQRLDEFNQEWASLLQSYELPSFHMRRLADTYSEHGPKLPRDRTIDQTIAALLPFADCINKHLEIGFFEAWDVKAYISLPKTIKTRLAWLIHQRSGS